MRATVSERLFARRFITNTGCWLWTGRLTRKGYGQISVGNGMKQVHRVAYQEFVGPIPDGLTLDHLCRVRHCFNTDHLEPVTLRENTLRGETITAKNIAKTVCPQGHPYDTENTRIYRGGRHCRTCGRLHSARWKQQHRERSTHTEGTKPRRN